MLKILISKVEKALRIRLNSRPKGKPPMTAERLRVRDLIVRPEVRALCQQCYPNHPKGCPNFGYRANCPPKAPLIGNAIDLSQPVFCIYNRFDFKAHTDKMKAKHPNWSKKQVECCLYWQGTARKQLKGHIKLFLFEHPGYHILDCPEACGVDITATMKNIGIELEWPPVNYTYQVALVGLPPSGKEE